MGSAAGSSACLQKIKDLVMMKASSTKRSFLGYPDSVGSRSPSPLMPLTRSSLLGALVSGPPPEISLAASLWVACRPPFFLPAACWLLVALPGDGAPLHRRPCLASLLADAGLTLAPGGLLSRLPGLDALSGGHRIFRLELVPGC